MSANAEASASKLRRNISLRSSGIPRFAGRAPDAATSRAAGRSSSRRSRRGRSSTAGSWAKPGSQKNSHTREFAGEIWYSRPQVGAVPAGPPLQTAPSVVQVLVQRFRPCSAPTLTHTSPAAHCGSPCCAAGAHDCPNPGKPPGLSVAASVDASPDVPLLLQPSAESSSNARTPHDCPFMRAVSPESRRQRRFWPGARVTSSSGACGASAGCGTHRGRHPASRPGPPRSAASGDEGAIGVRAPRARARRPWPAARRAPATACA